MVEERRTAGRPAPEGRNEARGGEPKRAVPGDVLLVLSDTRLRAFALAQLQEEGYQVVAVPDVRHARRLLSRGWTPRLVVADLSEVPEEEVRELVRGGVAVLGVGGQLEREQAVRLGVPFLARPFTVGQLAGQVRRLLGTPSGGGREA